MNANTFGRSAVSAVSALGRYGGSCVCAASLFMLVPGARA
jgi:hypothetical protein